MSHDTSLITTIVAGLVLAYIFGAIANRLRLPPLVGYLLAGVAVGPNSPGLVVDQALAPQLAEIGVVLLMFGVGLKFSLKDLLSVRAIVIPGVLLELVVIGSLGVGLAYLIGWEMPGALVFGLSLSVASTVVMLKALQDRHLTDSDRGRIAMGWLIVEDMSMVLALVLIPALAGLSEGAGALTSDPFVGFAQRLLDHPVGLYWVVGITLLKLAAFIGFMLIVGRRLIPFILHVTAHGGSRELFRLAVLAIALGVAAGASYLFGVSLALGAFFAGMILSESALSQRAAEETLPLRDAFAVLFFVSVGMLLKPQIFVEHPFGILGVLLIVLVGKSLLGFTVMLVFRQPLTTALTIGATVAQIGEFSFILIGLGVVLGLVPATAEDLIVAGAMISMFLNPIVFLASEKLRPRLEARARRRSPVTADLGPELRTEPELEPSPAPSPEPEPVAAEEPDTMPIGMRDHIILAGFGRVGVAVGAGLAESDAEFVVLDDAEGRIGEARASGYPVVPGNAAEPDVLRRANVGAARAMLVAIPNAFEAGQATEQARKLNPTLKIVARSHSEEEDAYLMGLGADAVISGEREIALGMLERLRPPEPEPAPTEPIPDETSADEPAEPAAIDPMHEAAAESAEVADSGLAATAEADAETPLEPESATPTEPDASQPPATAPATGSEVEPAPEPVSPPETEPEPAETRSATRPPAVIVLPDESGPDESELKDVSPRSARRVPEPAEAEDSEKDRAG